MASSLAGQVYSLATNQPTFFRAAPILFPKKIMSIMVFPEDDAQSRAKKLELLEKVEVIAKEAPWKFGFSEVKTICFLIISSWYFNEGDVPRDSLFFPGGAIICFAQHLVLPGPELFAKDRAGHLRRVQGHLQKQRPHLPLAQVCQF